METSHRRLTCDLEQKHKMEIERLLAEKETALAEETQVGLTACFYNFQTLLNSSGYLYLLNRLLWRLWMR